ncbi:DUF2846 domain-containing protein [Aliagarivorans taiwanensis]|uniref:DUF2846 domain-containing protein n=1 Tax=Aliagarivorans taiwanensis TaxID=561966 RepID=UPI00040FEBF5|nr:DUF2846 domain-containing protein [Aliagarivorans taiwanensis]
MNKLIFASVIVSSLPSGCASVPTESNAQEEQAKAFSAPSDSMAGLYIFRKDSFGGAALKKDVLVDGECIGETAKGVFFYHEVEGDQEHTLSTESEFSNNDIVLYTDAGELYFIEQYIKMGVFVGGAGLKQVESDEGKTQLAKLKMAAKGTCGNN